jgi:hypothetical protein
VYPYAGQEIAMLRFFKNGKYQTESDERDSQGKNSKNKYPGHMVYAPFLINK